MSRRAAGSSTSDGPLAWRRRQRGCHDKRGAEQGCGGDAARIGVREVTAVWWWFLILGILWTGLGMFVLSYRVGSLAVVATLTGVTFMFGGIAQLVVASWVSSWRWLFIVSGIPGVAAGIGTFLWPGVTLYVVSI